VIGPGALLAVSAQAFDLRGHRGARGLVNRRRRAGHGHLIGIGPDGLITDRPDIARQVLQGRRSEPR
jgi:hypothetical protein